MNKKILSIIIAALFCVITTAVFAEDNENAECSDYRAFIDYTPIDSYIIGGYTYISAEALVNYGFDVHYNFETHSINITRIRYATPLYSREVWENSICEKKQSKISDTIVKVYLEGNQIDCIYADNKVLIMIDNLSRYGEFNWNEYNKTVSITIFQHELEENLNKADNVVEIEYEADATFFRRGIATYKGQVNGENIPHGIGVAEFKDGLTRVKYLGYFSNGKPDGLMYKETFHTVTKSYVHRYIHFIGEIDASKESKREYISDDKYSSVKLLREPNFGVAILPIEEIPEWTGPEVMPDRTFYKKGCYYENWDGKTGCHEYRIWYDGEECQTITDICFYGAEHLDEFVNVLRKENNAVKYVSEFYEYKKQKLIFRNGYIHTVAGEPTVLNSPEHGAGIFFSKIPVFINGEQVEFKINPIIKNNRVLVPARVIFEKLGADVLWDGETQTVTAIKNGREVSLQINNNNMYFDGELYVCDVAPIIINDNTLVPIRVVAEAFFAEVNWDANTKQVEIFNS